MEHLHRHTKWPYCIVSVILLISILRSLELCDVTSTTVATEVQRNSIKVLAKVRRHLNKFEGLLS